MATRLDGPAPEQQIALDMVKRGLPVAPILILFTLGIWGVNGALSAGYGIALVLLNFLFAAGLIAWSARISLAMLMAAALFGFLIRLALISLAIWLVKDASWIDLVPLGITIIVTHLGLLIWETRYVSASLAFPGLKPSTDHQQHQR
ncbi:MAG: ATP synthase subunit I [Actinomycetia bacterium]|nr:ATP synthase subunit I [Actinomycetes bacterium]MCP4960222.1 ATP synthase subunit I [Actinomycetes bacterium]